MTDDCGIVFGATGGLYRNLARRAARNVRQVMPQAAIDLYTDEPLVDPVFDRVHLLDRSGPRPKMEALLRSRFRKTLWLDSDTVMLCDVSDLFDVLETADIVGAHEQFGSSPVAMRKVRRDIPPAFRQINSGVLGVRKSEATDAFLRRWQQDFVALKLQYDQPLLRELLYESDLRLVVLPAEYNQMFPPHIRVASALMMAPRILHMTHVHSDPKFADPPDRPFDPGELLNPPVVERINALLASDRTLGARAPARIAAGEMLRRVPRLHRIARRLRGFFA